MDKQRKYLYHQQLHHSPPPLLPLQKSNNYVCNFSSYGFLVIFRFVVSQIDKQAGRTAGRKTGRQTYRCTEYRVQKDRCTNIHGQTCIYSVRHALYEPDAPPS